MSIMANSADAKSRAADYQRYTFPLIFLRYLAFPYLRVRR
jgi:hypothetical protein